MTRVMGILNVTPDSFSDGGQFQEVNHAIARAEEMVAEGAEILDVGAESTRPGYVPVDAETEWKRLAPVLAELPRSTRVSISVDTQRASTAARAIEAGASIINDISFAGDPDMWRVIRESGVQYVLMHNRPSIDASLTVADIIGEIERGIERLLEAGVEWSQMIVDPGVGFAKTHEQNLACIRHIDRFRQLGYPVLLGTSRKRVVGNVLNLPVDERLEGTLATVAYAAAHHVDVVRVHDVLESCRVCRMTEAILGASQ